MGLYISHDAYSASYGYFHRWRIWLASKIGIELEKMFGFGGNLPWTSDNPLVELLNHSDCDGEIDYELLPGIIESLETVLSNITEPSKEEIESFIPTAERFIKGCQEAYEMEENLEFS